MKLLFVSMLALTSVFAHAQTYRQVIESSIKEVTFVDLISTLEIRGSVGNQLMISYVPFSTSNHPGDNVPNPGEIGLTVEKGSSKITINGRAAKLSTGKYLVDLPSRLAVNVQAGGDFTKLLQIKGVDGKLDISTDHDVEIQGLSNGLVLKNTAGHVKVTAEKNLRNPVSIITESGDVNFSMYIKFGVDLKLGTGTGAITALLSEGGGGLTTIKAKRFNSPFNGGGAVVQIQTLSGNIRILQYR